MGQEPDRIRQQIERTRAEMSRTVGALTYKADVKARARERLKGKRESAKGSIVSVNDKIVGGTPDSGEAKAKARHAASVAQENPLGLAFGSVAAGFLVGMLIPSTKVEDEQIGHVADDLKDKVRETGQEALEHGKQVAQDVAQSAQQTAKESGQQHAEDVKESAQQSAQDVKQSAQPTSGNPSIPTYQTR